MDTIYVTGHRNPDTDSIVSAMAYAALRNSLGDREYRPACLGRVSDETQAVLDRFGCKPPQLLENVRTQVCDLDYDTPPTLNAGVTISRAWHTIHGGGAHISAIPVTREDGTLYGMLSSGDIAAYDMSSVRNPHVSEVPLYNLLSVLEGKLLNEAGERVDAVSGEVTIALPASRRNLLFSDRESIVICGDQPDMIRYALELGVRCVIVCQSEVSEELRSLPTDACLISTPYDAYRTVRLICHSLPVSRVCRTEELVYFHLDDYIDDVRESVLKSRFRCYPILDEEGRVAGTLSRYHLLRPRRKRVVLVDHNEMAQSVKGLDQAEILEIIDHHRLADIQTGNPIYVRNEPVGSTTTIVAGMYQDKGLMPSEKMAGLMAAAIVSDTVMFKSPTCTQRDIDMANRMARIASISLEELGHTIFSVSGSDKSAEDLLLTDFKEFHIAGHDMAVSQITCVDSARMLERKDEFFQVMGELKRKKHYDMMILMLTDVLLEGTRLLYLGDDQTIQQAFNCKTAEGNVFLPRVMSRKSRSFPPCPRFGANAGALRFVQGRYTTVRGSDRFPGLSAYSGFPLFVRPDGQRNGHRVQRDGGNGQRPVQHPGHVPGIGGGGDSHDQTGAAHSNSHHDDDEKHPALFHPEAEHQRQGEGHHNQPDAQAQGSAHGIGAHNQLRREAQPRRQGHKQIAQQVLCQHHIPAGIGHHGRQLIPVASLIVGQGGVGHHGGIDDGKGGHVVSRQYGKNHDHQQKHLHLPQQDE